MGLRASETAAIKLNDIGDGKLTIHGKGHGEGKIVTKTIPKPLIMCIDEYISGERERDLSKRYKSEDHLIVTSGQRHGMPISASSIGKIMIGLSERSGIHVTYHSLRRFYCMTLANECGLRHDVDTLRRMMRHESIDTTFRCYLNADTDRIAQTEEKLESIFADSY